MATYYDYLFKLVVVGDSGVGKTSILLRYADDTYTDTHIATIGVDFKVKTLDMGRNRVTKLQLWDTAGQDRFKTIVGSFYRGAHGIIVVYDVTDQDSFQHVPQWFQEGEQHGFSSQEACKLLVGNKSDLAAQRVVPFDTAQALADSLNVPYLETSAKTSSNVEQVFMSMAQAMLGFRRANPTPADEHSQRTILNKGPCRSGVWTNSSKSVCNC